MADFVFNIAKGRVAELYNRVDSNDPANSAIIIVPVDVGALGVDLLAVSAHKLGGPKGVGALVVRPGCRVAPLVLGGSHENGLRAGTHNVPGIVGFGCAAELAAAELGEYAGRVGALRDRLERAVLAGLPDAVVVAGAGPRVPNTSLLAFPGAETQTLLVALDLAGVAAGAGAACAAGGVDPSHVTVAMGLPDAVRRSVVRFSLGRETTAAAVDAAAALIVATVRAQLASRAARARVYAD